MTTPTPITVAYGDGIGPEIMKATLSILDAADAKLAPEVIEIGEKAYNQGVPAGIRDTAWASLRRTKVFLKAPITTPQGKGFKSLNVTVRKTLGMYANVRPCRAYVPFVSSNHPDMDLVIVRENEEDLYGGIEHRQTHEVCQALKLISEPGSERIIRYAFEYAKAYGRNKVTCMTKDNIMKLSDGLFHKVFDRIAAEYPDIENEHWIIDIGTAKLADSPEIFEVVVTLNLYGDIISDVTAQIAGSVGMGGSANVGEHCAMFEAIHGSAPRYANQDIANPSGLLMGAIMMLVHIDQNEVAETVHNAWLKTIEEGVHTPDIYNDSTSTQKVGTQAFAAAVIERLGQKPQKLAPVDYKHAKKSMNLNYKRPISNSQRELVGVDVFLYAPPDALDHIVKQCQSRNDDAFELSIVTVRGSKVWPDQVPETFLCDHWRCRFKGKQTPLTPQNSVTLQQNLVDQGLDIIKTEHLYTFDGVPGFSQA